MMFTPEQIAAFEARLRAMSPEQRVAWLAENDAAAARHEQKMADYEYLEQKRARDAERTRIEQEFAARQQALEAEKRKAMESLR
jgi:hypothetical protein